MSQQLRIIQGNNLDALKKLSQDGEKFDLIELDGPYAAGLEAGWDCLTEDEYLAHYAERLTLVRQLLQPWGVVFVFGYPEGCAEIKAWARQSGTLHLRRWLHWHKQKTAHKGRKVEVIAMFVNAPSVNMLASFKALLTDRRKARGLTVTQAMAMTPSRQHLAGKGCGMMWFEAPSSDVPTAHEYIELKALFNIPDEYDFLCTLGSYEGITDLDYISTHYPEDTRDLNDNGLRSKPIGLYLDLFRPTMPPRDTKRALILYGGSGNAGIAAGQLGYDVTICEQDAARCEAIRRRYAWKVDHRDETPLEDLGPLFNFEAA